MNLSKIRNRCEKLKQEEELLKFNFCTSITYYCYQSFNKNLPAKLELEMDWYCVIIVEFETKDFAVW